MNLTREDRLRIWKALAAYIEECRKLSADQELGDYYQAELQEAQDLRRRINTHENS